MSISNSRQGRRRPRGYEAFPSITHSRWGKQRIREKVRWRGKVANLHTTLVSNEGPEPGTIWFDNAADKHEPDLIVRRVTRDRVFFSEGRSRSLKEFFEALNKGALILTGIAAMQSHTY
jgi:hypothetical protein